MARTGGLVLLSWLEFLVLARCLRLWRQKPIEMAEVLGSGVSNQAGRLTTSIIGILSFMTLTLSCVEPTYAPTKMLTLKEAIGIANREALRLGYDLSTLVVEADEENSAWDIHVAGSPNIRENQRLMEQLKNRKYWAIYYGPRKPAVGGDLFILIDATTGEIIAVDRGA